MSIKTYVYGGNEVSLTGRIANKKLYSGRLKVLYEIHPINIDNSDKSYNKWVEMNDLFEIEDN